MKKAWIPAILLAPLLQTASGCSWITVAVMAAACGILKAGVEKYGVESPKWLDELRWIWNLLILTEAMEWIAHWWPEGKRAVPLILLSLASILAAGGTAKVMIAAGAMLWLQILLTAPVILAAIREIRWEYLEPRWQMSAPALITVLLTPTVTDWKKKWIPAIGIAAATQGVLSLGVMAAVENPLMELGRSLSLFGTVKRFESLIAVGMTLGFFAFLSYVLSEKAQPPKQVILSALLAAAVYLTGYHPGANIVAVGVVVLEVLIPILIALKRN